MQLAVDIGNSRIKYAVFKDEELIESDIDDRDPTVIVKDNIEKFPAINAIIISSVNEQIDPESITIPETANHVFLDHKTPIPLENEYKSPETLGHDRIALMVALQDKFPGQNALVIDIGTCVTYDLVNDKSTYVGGIISPGIGLRYSAMHSGTARLPQIEFDPNRFPGILGTDTVSCMETGVLQGLSNEIEGTIKHLELQFNDLKIMLTGGDYKMFEKALKNSIFADPNAVLRGLNKILQYNLSNE